MRKIIGAGEVPGEDFFVGGYGFLQREEVK